MAKKSSYYEGGYKVMLHGAPCKVFVKPTPHMLAVMRGEQYEPSNRPLCRELASSRFPQVKYSAPPWVEELIAGSQKALGPKPELAMAA